MGKSQDAKNVNSDLNSRYKTLNSGGSDNPYNPYQKMLGSDYASNQGNANALMGDAYNRFSHYADTGGVTPENAARIRGNGVFDEFAKTGGYTQGDVRNIRARAGSANTGLFSSLRDRLATQNAASGGINPGYTAQMAKMARDQGHAAADAQLDTETGIKSAINQGREWGAGSLSDAEKSLLAATQAGQEFGMSGINNLFGTMNSNSQNDLGRMLQALGMNQQEIDQILGARSQRFENKSGFDKYGMPLISAATGALTSFLK